MAHNFFVLIQKSFLSRKMLKVLFVIYLNIANTSTSQLVACFCSPEIFPTSGQSAVVWAMHSLYQSVSFLFLLFILLFCILFQTKLIKHGSSEKCMAISRNKDKIVMETCNEAENRQMWNMENFNADRLSPELTAE